MKHRERHPNLDVEDCFTCRVSSVSFSAAATPNRRPEANRINQKDAAWDRDMGAYKRLRKDGLQPPTIDGSRRLEQQATEKSQVETGIL